MESGLEFSTHAIEQMRYRNISEADVIEAFESMRVYEAKADYSVNVWGRDLHGRRLRITYVPEIRYVITVGEAYQQTLGTQLGLRANNI